MAFAENVRKYREIKGMSQLELANKLEVAQVQVARYETGARVPNIIVGAQLAKILGTTVEKLVEQEENHD